MPKLPSYTADLSPVSASSGRRATPGVVGAEIANVGAVLGQTAKDIMQATEADDLRTVQVQHAQLRADYARQLEEAKVSGAPLEPIREKFERDLSDIQGVAVTRAGLEASDLHAANSMNVFDSTAADINIYRAGQEAQTAANDFINAQGTMVQNNPSYLLLAEQEADAFASTYAGKLPPQKIAEMKQVIKQQLNMAAALSLADTVPDHLLKIIGTNQFNLTPEQRLQAKGAAEREIRTREEEKRQARIEADYQKRATSDAARDEHFQKIISGKAKVRDIMKDDRLTPEHREHLIVFNKAWWEEKTSGERKSNPRVVNDLATRIFAPDGDPRKIYTNDPVFEALDKGQINVTDFRRLTADIAFARDENNSTLSQRRGVARNALARVVTQAPQFIAQPEKAFNILLRWDAIVAEKMQRLREEKKDPGQIFDLENKESVVSPAFVAKLFGEAQADSAPANIPDLRQNPDAWRDVPVGSPFVDPKGVTRTMSKETRDALEKTAPAPQPSRSSSGTIKPAMSIPDNRKQYEEKHAKYMTLIEKMKKEPTSSARYKEWSKEADQLSAELESLAKKLQ